MAHQIQYDFFLVFISFVVAIFASYVALDLTRTIPLSRGWTKSAWLMGAALIMGFGIWSMHFIGMMAIQMPGHHFGYDLHLLIISIVVPIVASSLAFSALSQSHPSSASLIWRGVAMAIAIAGMHYTGMYSMMMPFNLEWHYGWVAVSIVIALVASFAALLVALKLRTEKRYFRFQATASLLLGIAIAGMHYSAMEAAIFIPADLPSPTHLVVVSDTLALVVTVCTTLILFVAFAGAFIQRILSYKSRESEENKRLYQETEKTLSQVKRKTEEELLIRETQLKEAQAIAQVGSWEWDIAEDIIFWSDELFRIYDVNPAEFKDSYKAYMETLNPETRAILQSKVQRCLETGEPYELEQRVVKADNSVRFFYSRGRAIKDSSGKIIKLSGTVQDITDRKLIEQKLIESQAELEKRVIERTAQLHESLEREKKATEAKMQFLANMSHEIRTPMNAIIGFSELLVDTPLNEEQQGYLSRIKTNSGQLLRLIDDILDLSKFEAGRIPVEKSRISLSDLLTDVLESFSLEAEKKGLGIQVYFRTGIPQYILSDAMRLRQIIGNLVGNALKFSRMGNVQLHLTYLKSENKSDLILDVEDKGIGISEADQKKLFQPFSQADSSVVRRFGGTGLGLALSRRIAEALGGQLVLHESTPGVGSRFRLTLQLEEIETPFISGLKGGMGSIAGDASPDPSSLEQARILLAEDSLDNEILIRSYLQSSNIKIDVANNGLEAVEMATQGKYDCILMDIQMPKMDGLEATKRLRASGFNKPIIALTAHALLEEVDRSLAAGCNIHLTKPINRKLLIQTLQTQIQIKKSEANYFTSES